MTTVLQLLPAFVVISSATIEYAQAKSPKEVVLRHKRQAGCGQQCASSGCCGLVCCALPPPVACCAPPTLPQPTCCLPQAPAIPQSLPCCAPTTQAPLPICPPICQLTCIRQCVNIGCPSGCGANFQISFGCGAGGCGRRRQEALQGQRDAADNERSGEAEESSAENASHEEGNSKVKKRQTSDYEYMNYNGEYYGGYENNHVGYGTEFGSLGGYTGPCVMCDFGRKV